MTIEELASSLQREFNAINKNMATKKDIENLVTKADFEGLQHAVEGIDLKMSSYASRWTEDFSKLHDWVKELDGRLRLIEKTK